MNKIITNSTILSIGLAVVATTFAAKDHTSDFYVRPEAGISNFQLSDKVSKAVGADQIDIKQLKEAFSSSVPTGGIVFGKQLGNIGVELGFSALRASSDKFMIGSSLANDASNTGGEPNYERAKEYVRIENAINNISLDANYDFEVGHGFHLLPSVGLGYMHSKVSFDNTAESVDQKTLNDLKRFAKNNVNDVQPRAGVSALYSLGKNLNLTSGVNYQAANNFYNGVTTIKAGFELSV